MCCPHIELWTYFTSFSLSRNKPETACLVFREFFRYFFIGEQILTLAHSDWVTGKRGRRNSVGSLDSTIEVSLVGWGNHAWCELPACISLHVCLIHKSWMCWKCSSKCIVTFHQSEGWNMSKRFRNSWTVCTERRYDMQRKSYLLESNRGCCS